MTKPPIDSSFTSDVAQLYESTRVPLIFPPNARDLAERVTSLTPATVLEVACGTGVVTRASAEALPERSSVVAADLSQAMVAPGESVGTAPGVINLEQLFDA